MTRKCSGDLPLLFTTGVRIDLYDREMLDQIAQEKKVARNFVIREAIRDYLSKSKKRTW